MNTQKVHELLRMQYPVISDKDLEHEKLTMTIDDNKIKFKAYQLFIYNAIAKRKDLYIRINENLCIKIFTYDDNSDLWNQDDRKNLCELELCEIWRDNKITPIKSNLALHLLSNRQTLEDIKEVLLINLKNPFIEWMDLEKDEGFTSEIQNETRTWVEKAINGGINLTWWDDLDRTASFAPIHIELDLSSNWPNTEEKLAEKIVLPVTENNKLSISTNIAPHDFDTIKIGDTDIEITLIDDDIDDNLKEVIEERVKKWVLIPVDKESSKYLYALKIVNFDKKTNTLTVKFFYKDKESNKWYLELKSQVKEQLSKRNIGNENITNAIENNIRSGRIVK